MTETTTAATAPPPDILLRMAEAATDLHKYALMEASWNGAVVGKGELPTGDARDQLVVLKDDLADQLELVGKQTDFLLDVFAEFGPWLDQAVAEALESDHLTDDQVEQLRSSLGGTDVAARGTAKAQTLIGEVPKNVEILRGDFDDLTGPTKVMSSSTGCTMIDVAMMAGLALCIPTEGAGCVLALAAMIAHAALCPH